MIVENIPCCGDLHRIEIRGDQVTLLDHEAGGEQELAERAVAALGAQPSCFDFQDTIATIRRCIGEPATAREWILWYRALRPRAKHPR